MNKLCLLLIVLALIGLKFVGYHPINYNYRAECNNIIIRNEEGDSLLLSTENIYDANPLDSISEVPIISVKK